MDKDECGVTDPANGQVCTRGAGHPGNHRETPEGREF
jgi:hypothetical protein